MKSFVEMHHRPYRPPRKGRHFGDEYLICMEWQMGQALWQLDVIIVEWDQEMTG